MGISSKTRVVLKSACYVMLTLVLSATVARADSNPTLTFTGGYSLDPNSPYGIGPYGGTLGTQSRSFYCVDFSHDIDVGDSWTVSLTNLTGPDYSVTRLGPGSGVTYLEMAWLVTQLNSAPAGSAQAAADQWAIWLLSTTAPIPLPLAYSGSTGPLSASFLDTEAQNAVASGFTVNGWEILTPTGTTGQEFLITPEPSSWLYALGTVLVILIFKQKPLYS